MCSICLLLIFPFLFLLCSFYSKVHRCFFSRDYLSLEEWGYFQVFWGWAGRRNSLKFLFGFILLNVSSLNLLFFKSFAGEHISLNFCVAPSNAHLVILLVLQLGYDFVFSFWAVSHLQNLPRLPWLGHTQLEMACVFIFQLHLSCYSLVSVWVSWGTLFAFSHVQSTDFNFITNKESRDRPFNILPY